MFENVISRSLYLLVFMLLSTTGRGVDLNYLYVCYDYEVSQS